MKHNGYDKKYVIRHRILAVVALLGLFACGLMVGVAVTKTKTVVQKIETVAKDIVTKDSLPDKTCSAVEKVLEAMLNDETERTECWVFQDNIRVYDNLIDKGCSENHDKYVALKNRSSELAAAACIYENKQMMIDDSRTTCEKIRDEMLGFVDAHANGFNGHMQNAKTYAVIAERGCASEAEHYKELAEQELAVARAVTDDNLSERDTIDVIETYKKLQMQAAAQEMFDKAKRLTNPAIDFILEVEKIINE